MKAGRLGASAAVVGGILWLCVALSANSTTVALALLLAILGISTRWGIAEAGAASVLAVLGLNYFFLPPVGTFTIEDPQNWIALLAFLITAVTASQLSSRARRRAAEAEERRRELERLYALVRGTMLGGYPRHTIREFLARAVQSFDLRGAAFYSAASAETFRAGVDSDSATEHSLKFAAELPHPSVDREGSLALAPVRLGARPLGGMGLVGAVPPEPVVRAIADLLAISIERDRAVDEASQAEAVRKNEALKGALLDALAHDIKTPLTSIKAAATGMLGVDRTESDREMLTVIDEEADRLNQLAAEVIAMARIEAGKLHLERRPVAVDEMVAGAIQELRPGAKGCRFRVEIAPDLPPADADPDFIGQALKQLLDNALKYSPEGEPVSVSARLNGGRIVISVADRGPGIDEDELGRIFDKYFRGREQRDTVKGTGMGLSIAKGIVEAHRGRLWVDSEKGHGSIFFLSLPPAGLDGRRG